MSIADWSERQKTRMIITAAVLLIALIVLYVARTALLPFILGTILVYIMLPIIDWLDARLQLLCHNWRLTRTLSVLILYLLLVAGLIGLLAFVIPPIATQISRLLQGLPQLVEQAYRAIPDIVQVWLDRYDQLVPQDIRLAIERSFQDRLQALFEALQSGVFKSVGVLFSTVSFVLGFVIIPLWMFYLLRDQPEIEVAAFRLVPVGYRDDARSIRVLVDDVLGSYLRGQVILSFSVGLMSYAAFEMIDLDFALLLGTLVGVFEIIPILGPVLGAIPAIIVASATAPDRFLWVVIITFVVQLIENNLLLPLVAGGTVRLHPALVMIALVVGGAIGGFAGLVLSVPLTAVVRDVTYYLYLRLTDDPLPPEEALARVRRRY
jgi:predicted PurR-regulated permease PerM